VIDFVRRRYWFIGMSLAVIIVGVVFLALPPGLRLGIDFTSGTTFAVDFEQDPGVNTLRDAVTAADGRWRDGGAGS